MLAPAIAPEFAVPAPPPDNAPRVAPLKKLSPMQLAVTRLLARGRNYASIAASFGISVAAVKFHANNAAKRIPGDLPAQMRLVMWWRGASLDALTGRWVNDDTLPAS